MSPLAAGFAAGLAGWAAYGSVYAAAANLRYPARGQRVRTPLGALHVATRGETGPWVACLHGASANGREFDRVGAILESNARLALIDRPGHGHSPRGRDAHTLAAQARLVAAVLGKVADGPAIILAHSLGCATALRLALDHPEHVAGLVLVAPASHPYPGLNSWHARLAARPLIGTIFARLCVPLAGPLLARAAIANTFKPAAPPPDYARTAGTALLFRPRTFRANAQDLIATKAEFEAQYYRYDEIDVPSIVVTADADRVVNPRIHARALARAMAAKISEVHISGFFAG